jgi:putative endonuclease
MSYSRGVLAEQRAAEYLSELGVRILARNFRCNQGELDLIGMDAGTLCFIEVRQRTRSRYGSALETIGYQKKHRIIRTAQVFLSTAWRGPECPCRFDVVTIEGGDPPRITRLKGAFEL